MTLEEIRIEESRLRIRFQSFWEEKSASNSEIAFAAAEEMKDLLDYCTAGYPALSSDWLISLWEIHPYQEPLA